MFGPKVPTDVFKVFIHSAALSKNCFDSPGQQVNSLIRFCFILHFPSKSSGTAGLFTASRFGTRHQVIHFCLPISTQWPEAIFGLKWSPLATSGVPVFQKSSSGQKRKKNCNYQSVLAISDWHNYQEVLF